MTANVKIEIAKRTNALRIPNAALRFRPTERSLCGAQQDAAAGSDGVRGRRAWRPRGRRCAATGHRRGGAGDTTPPTATQASRANTASRPTATSAAARATIGASHGATATASRRRAGRGGRGGGRGGGGGFGGGGGRGGPEFQARMLERFKTMSPEEQQQFLARMKERGGDTGVRSGDARRRAKDARRRRRSAQAQTIDALVRAAAGRSNRAGARGCIIDKQLKPVTLRLGISDGTYTEVISDELQENIGGRHRRDRTATSTRQHAQRRTAAIR